MSNCKPDYKLAKSEALNVLYQMGYDKPPVNPMQVAERLGFKVKGAMLRDDVSGMYNYKEKTIYYNHKDTQTRQFFAVAHELGHILLHQEYASSKEYRVLLHSPRKEDGYELKYELEANAFATNLMMPQFMLDKLNFIGSKEHLARIFCVSLKAIKNRAGFFSRFTNKYEQWY